MLTDFTFDFYEGLLQALISNGHEMTTFSEAPTVLKGTRKSLLRHDIDKSVSKAVIMAEIEASLGLKATYFVRLHSNYYNPYGHIVSKQLREILSLGHEIGLHTEFYDYGKIQGLNPKDVFRDETHVLEKIVGKEVKSFSLHRTTGSTSIDELMSEVKAIAGDFGMVNAYSDAYFKDIKYISDSSGSWKSGNPLEWVNQENLQVLTHPDWWYRDFIELEEPII